MLRLVLLVLLVAPALAQEPRPRTFTVAGVERRALVFVPESARETAAPLVFAFHGWGGAPENLARRLSLERAWPAAIAVYPQGLPIGGRSAAEARPGWQRAVGQEGDRDLALVDAILAALEAEVKVDRTRLFATGHSNGGSMSYLLAAARPGLLAAIAPSAGGSVALVEAMKPTPVLHFAGTRDQITPFEGQERTMGAVRKLNGCAEEGSEWAPRCTLYPSAGGTPFAACVFDGGHDIHPEMAALAVRFFQEHALRPPPAK